MLQRIRLRAPCGPFRSRRNLAEAEESLMLLTISNVAQLCAVGENRVFKWVREEGLPAERVGGSYRVNPVELIEWATTRGLAVSPVIFQKMNGDSVGEHALHDALKIGGVVSEVPGKDRESILRSLVGGLPLPRGFSPESLVQMLMARELMGGTALGGGITIPHPRRPVVMAGAQSVVRLGFLKEALDCDAPDGQAIDTLFLVICPTVRIHLQHLALLASVLREDSFRQTLRARPAPEVILKEVLSLEDSFQKPSDSAPRGSDSTTQPE